MWRTRAAGTLTSPADPGASAFPRRSGRPAFNGHEPRDAIGPVHGEIYKAVGADDHVADTPDILEQHLLPRHARALDFEAPQFLRGERAHEQVPIPLRKGIAAVEVDRAHRDRRCPLGDRLLHALVRRAVGHGSAVVVHAIRDDRPAVVAPRLDDVDLVAASRSVLDLPQLTGDRMPHESLRVAVAIAPDTRHRAGLLREGIVVGHPAIVPDAVDLAVRPRD